jgi:hypothetical protein
MSHVADLWNVKDSYNDVEVTIVGEITGHFLPIVPTFPGRGRVVVDVGVPGSASGNFQSRVSTISL